MEKAVPAQVPLVSQSDGTALNPKTHILSQVCPLRQCSVVSFPLGLPGTQWHRSCATCRVNSISPVFPPVCNTGGQTLEPHRTAMSAYGKSTVC